MPIPSQDARGNPLLRRDVQPGEGSWTLVSQTEFDGLAPSQIVRQADAHDRGWGDDETHSRLAARLDATPDADNRLTNEPPDETEPKGATTDTHRYVVDPTVEDHVYAGLFTGGPARHVEAGEPGQRHKVVQQTLTRTFCAGHGFAVDPATGRFVYSADPESRGYETVEGALRRHRHAVKRIFNSRLAFRSDIPGMYRTEVVWRDFTHESIPFIEAKDGSGREAARRALRAIYGDDLGEVSEIHAQIDPNTNTVVVTAAALFKFLSAPTTPEDLLAMPCLEGPCTRETLREFGWNDLADGEGYRFVHTFRFFDIKDVPEVRHFLEFGVHDKDVLTGEHVRRVWVPDEGSDGSAGSDGDPSGHWSETTVPGLLRREELRDNPFLVPVADEENGRYAFEEGGKRRAWWRILKLDARPDDQYGTLDFTIACLKPQWFGAVDDAHRVDAVRENPEGIGEARRTVYPSIPREDAKAEAEKLGAETVDGKKFLLGAVQRTEGEAGREDISVQRARVFTWQGADKPERTVSLDGVEGSAVQHTTTAKREEWEVTFDRLDGEAMAALIASVSAQLVPDPGQGRIVVKGCQQVGDGAYRLTLHAKGVKKIAFAAWLYTGNYFYEIWRELHFNFKPEDCTEGGLDGHDIVTSDRSLNDDGTWDERLDRRKPSEPRHLRFKAKRKAHGKPVDHDWFRNETDLPQGLKDGSVAGRAAYNEHGLIDGETSDVDDDDGSGRTIEEDHFHKVESERSTDESSRAAEAGFQTGVITRVSETDNGDGTFTHGVTKDTAKECSHVTFKTKEGSLYHPREVTHHVFVNAPELPGPLASPPEGTARVSGSARHNRYGLHDGQYSEWDAADEEGVTKGKAEDRFHVERTETAAGDKAPAEPSFAKGKIASHTTVTFGDGTKKVSAKTDDAKPAEWSYSYVVHQGDKTGRVRVFVKRNQESKPEFPPPAADETLHVVETLNPYDLWDASATYTPNWKAKKSDDDAMNREIDFTHYTIRFFGFSRGNFSARTSVGAVPHSPAFAPSIHGYWGVECHPEYYGCFDSAEKAVKAARRHADEGCGAPDIRKLDNGTYVYTLRGPWTHSPVYNGPIPDILRNRTATQKTWHDWLEG